MGKHLAFVVGLMLPSAAWAQGYTNWFVGNAEDAVVQALGGSCLMGGATEHDDAMRWFLQRANGGDVLVLRASGSNGYQNYFHSELGIPVNSVETIRFDNATAANSTYVQDRIRRAEAIWFAGGDQWNYVNFWRNTPIDSLINVAINERNIVIGGTSAGLAILGGVYFSAQNGSVTSNAALLNPYNASMAVSNQPFLQVPFLAEVVTDSHYDNPDRRGRHVAFMARAKRDWGLDVKGIACNEYTAVCIDTDGIARVYGEWPAYPEFAYFLQINCLHSDGPEMVQAGVPLTWNHGGEAVKVYKVAGTMQGTNTFDLNDWRSGSGGTWESWSVLQGQFSVVPGDPAPDCITAVSYTTTIGGTLLYDALSNAFVVRDLPGLEEVLFTDLLGRSVGAAPEFTADGVLIRDAGPAGGMRLLRVRTAYGERTWKLFVP
ncbi:MAG: cyanophycinase [Flavobacteriales bacterium]|nr:cyanophycinase [Flavobacteriales bacterium]